MAEVNPLLLLEGSIRHFQHADDQKSTDLSLHTGEKIHVQRAIEPYFFRKDDHLQCVFDENRQQLYAILNHSQNILYLHADLQQYDPVYLKRPFFKILFAIFTFYFFSIISILSMQLIIDADIFYADLVDTLHFFHLPILVIAVICFVTRFKDTHATLAQDVFSLLQLPVLQTRHLTRLQACNSYFEKEKDVFDLTVLMQKLSLSSIDEVQHALDENLQKLDQFHLSAWQRERFALKKISGVIQSIQQHDVPYSDVDTDPYIEIQAIVNGTPIYGYVDEFHLVNKAKVDVLISSFRDDKGYYFWYLYDQKRFIYLDEDQPVMNVDWQTILIVYGIVGTVVLLIAFFFGISDGWEAFMTCLLLGLVVQTLIFIIFYLYLKFFDDEERYTHWVAQYIQKNMSVKGIAQLDDFFLYRIWNQKKQRSSRTGYDLENKKE